MASFDRRALITGALAAAFVPGIALAGPVPPTNNLHFNILRNGKPFGQYNVAFATNGDLLTVTTDVAMNLRLATLTVFDYRHHCVETWRGGRFLEMRSSSVRDRSNDLTDTVTAVRSDLGIHISTNKGPLSAPLDANPLTHWNPAVLNGPLFNPQDGLMLEITALPMGRNAATLANGSQASATLWALRGKQTLDEWYDDRGVWTGLKAVFPDKSIIEYRRT